MTEADPEADTTKEGQDGNDGVVPNEKRVGRERDEGLTDSGRECAHEQVYGHDQRLHVLGRLGESVLVRGHVGEDLRDTNENVGQRLCPHVDRRDTLKVRRVGAAWRLPVDVLLHHGCGDHRERAEEEADTHSLDGGETDAELAEGRVNDVVHDGDHDDDGDGVQVLDDVVGDPVQLHGRRLGGQVTSHLVVGEVEERQEEEDLAGEQTTADLVNPGIVVRHPDGPLVDGDVGGPDDLPGEAAPAEPLALHGVPEHAHELGQDGARGRRQDVVLAADEEDDGGGGEQDGGEQEREPEPDELLDVHHGDLAAHRPDVDGEVEVEEDAGVGHGRVDDDALPLAHLDAHPRVPVLLGQERRDVGLEEARARAEDHHADDEGAERPVGVPEHRGDGRDDEDDVGERRDRDGHVDDLVSAEMGIRKITPGKGVSIFVFVFFIDYARTPKESNAGNQG